LSDKGDYDAAEPLFREALAIDKKALGNDHPGVATDLNNLAQLLWTKDKSSKEAVRLGLQALEIAEKKLGHDHPRTEQYRRDWG